MYDDKSKCIDGPQGGLLLLCWFTSKTFHPYVIVEHVTWALICYHNSFLQDFSRTFAHIWSIEHQRGRAMMLGDKPRLTADTPVHPKGFWNGVEVKTGQFSSSTPNWLNYFFLYLTLCNRHIVMLRQKRVFTPNSKRNIVRIKGWAISIYDMR